MSAGTQHRTAREPEQFRLWNGAAKKEGPDAVGTQIINQKKSLGMLSFWSQALRRLYGCYDLVQIKECGRCSALLGFCQSQSQSCVESKN